MPPPQQLLSSAVSITTKWLNPTFLVLLVFLIVAGPLSTPSATSQQQQSYSSQSHSSRSQQQQQPSSSSTNTSYTKYIPNTQWPHWTVNPGEVCPSAKRWATHPGAFCVTLWNSPYLSNRTELEAREKRAIQFYCEMDRILERFDCAQEYSVNVQRGQCKLCRDAYREWSCAMVTDTLDDGQLDCDTKLMPCPSCASICHQVMRLCPYLSPDRNQADREGRLSPQVSQYGGHPAFYCPLENDDPSDPAYTSLCFDRSPFSSDPDYVHNVCTNPPIHHHQDQQYVRHPDRNNNDKNSYYNSNQNKRIRIYRNIKSSSSFPSERNSAEQVKNNYLNKQTTDGSSSKHNKNPYFNSEAVINSKINSNPFSNQMDYTSEEFLNPVNPDDNDDDNWASKILHYTTCCWTYASSVVHFSKTQEFPNYGSDSYFSAVETSSSSSLNPFFSSSSSADRETTPVNNNNSPPVSTRKPSSVSDNRVILNCCDSHGNCNSKDPSENDEDEDLETFSSPPASDTDSFDNFEPSPPAASESTFKSSHNKRSSENDVDVKTNNFHFYPVDPEGAAGNYLKNIPKISPQNLLLVNNRVKDNSHDSLSSSKSAVQQKQEQMQQDDDSLPKPTHITPGLDYDEHYLDTEPDGDGGSSSTELEDEDVFEPGFDWEKGGKSHNNEGGSTIGSSKNNPGDSRRSYNNEGNGGTLTFSSSSSSIHQNNNNKLQQNKLLQDNLKTPIESFGESSEIHHLEATTTTINNYRNNYKNDNNKLTNLLKDDSSSKSKSIRSRSSSSSSSVHYQKNAFMAIVIGGDDVDRRHLNLRTATSTFGDEIVDSSNDKLLFESSQQFSSSDSNNNFVNSGPFDFSDNVDEDDNNNNKEDREEEIYYARTPQQQQGDSLKEKVVHYNNMKSVPLLPGVEARLLHYGYDDNFAVASSSSSASPRPSSFKIIITKIFSHLTLSSTTSTLTSSTSTTIVESKSRIPFTTTTTTFSSSLQKPIRTFDSTDCCHLVLLLFLILVTTSNFLPVLLLSTGDDIQSHLPKTTATSTTKSRRRSKTFTIHSTLSSSSLNNREEENKEGECTFSLPSSSCSKGEKKKCDYYDDDDDDFDDKCCHIDSSLQQEQQDYCHILENNERVKKAVVLEIDGEFKKYYDDIRNTTLQNNGVAVLLWTFTYYNSNNCKKKILKANTPVFKDDYDNDNCYNDKGTNTSKKVFENNKATTTTTTKVNYNYYSKVISSSSAPHRLLKLLKLKLKKLKQIKRENDDEKSKLNPFMIVVQRQGGAAVTRSTNSIMMMLMLKPFRNYNDTAGDSCSNLLALLYYKMVKFFIILQLRSSDTSIITSTSFQHNVKNKTTSKRKTKILIQTFFHSTIANINDDGFVVYECVVKWVDYYYDDYNYYIIKYNYYIKEAYVENCNSLLKKELFKNFSINSILFSIDEIFLVLVIVANYYCHLEKKHVGLHYKFYADVSLVLVVLEEKSRQRRRKNQKKKAAGLSAELRVLLLLISDSRVTTNCTTNYIKIDRKYYYNYANNVHYSSRMITIINKLIQFVVQYDLLDYVDDEGQRFNYSDLNLNDDLLRRRKGKEVRRVLLVVNFEQNTKEFLTNSYSKCLAFLLLNIKKISISSNKINYDDESIRWLSRPCPISCSFYYYYNYNSQFHVKCYACSKHFSSSTMTIVIVIFELASQLIIYYYYDSSWTESWRCVDKNSSCDFPSKINNDINNGKKIKERSKLLSLMMLLLQENPESLEVIITIIQLLLLLLLIIITINIRLLLLLLQLLLLRRRRRRGHFHGQSSIISTKLGNLWLLNDNNYKNSSIRVVVRVRELKSSARCSLSGSGSLTRSNKLTAGEQVSNKTFSVVIRVLYSLPFCPQQIQFQKIRNSQLKRNLVPLLLHRKNLSVVPFYNHHYINPIILTTLMPLLKST